MKSEWVTVPLGDVLTLQRGHDLPAQNRLSGEIPILGSSGITGFHNEAKATGPGVTVGRSGNSMGEISYSDKDFWPLNTALYVTDFKGNDPKFLYYLLQTIDFDQFNSGSAQKSLNRNAVYPFEVEIPKSRAEQERISSVLSSLEEKVGVNQKINQTLEQMAQAILKSWFVDFEPVKAKIAALEAGGSEEDALLAAMQAISGKGEAELTRLQAEQPEQYAELRATAELFPSAMQDSELGEIPEGWKSSSIYEICDVIYGAPFKSKLFNQTGDGIPLIRIRDLKNERPGVSTTEQHPKGYLVQNGDLLVGMDGEFKPYVWGSGSSWMNQRVCCFKPKSGYSVGLVKGFIEPQLREYELTATATTVIHLGKGDIDRFSFVDAGVDLLHGFSRIVDPLYGEIVSNKTSSNTLEQLRDILLPKLLSGELSVSSAEDQLAKVSESANV